jgi:3-methylfumaryl-CoA hydratase
MSPEANLSAEEIDSYRRYVGRSLVETDAVCVDVIRRVATALDASWENPAPLEPMWHFGLFPSMIPTAQLASDGHPPRGPFMPPVRLPRRMFAGSDIRFLGVVVVGREAVRRSNIVAVDHRRGRSGELVFVRVQSTITQSNAPCIEEEQTIVYRTAGGPVPAVCEGALPALADGEVAESWTPSSVELFRYSAIIFNAHRIHYDRAYVTDIEGYPDLVVHGPLVATRLCQLAGRAAGRPLTRFAFRAEAPTFVNQPVRLVARRAGVDLQLRAERADGTVAMSASATCA